MTTEHGYAGLIPDGEWIGFDVSCLCGWRTQQKRLPTLTMGGALAVLAEHVTATERAA